MTGSPSKASRGASSAGGRLGLVAGICCGPVLGLLVAGQMALRSGFNVLHQPMSLLTLGDAGWVQRAAFVLSGVLAVAGAVGLARSSARSGPWLTRLLVVFGVSTALAGLFVPDAAFGFPPGTPPGAPETMSTHSMIHGVCFDIAFAALVAAMVLMAVQDRRQGLRGWSALGWLTAVMVAGLIAAGIFLPEVVGGAFLGAAILGFAWLTFVFVRARATGPSHWETNNE